MKTKERWMMIKNYNRKLTRSSGIISLLVVVLMLAACTTMNKEEPVDAPVDEPSESIIVETQVEEKDNSQEALRQEMTIGNYYLTVTDHKGSMYDGDFLAAGFLGYYKSEYFQERVNEYGYGHLSRVPLWADCGGNEAWIIIPKYNDSQIIVKALDDLVLEAGTEYSAGDIIIEAEESLIVYTVATDLKPTIEITVISGEEIQTFAPSVSMIEGGLQLPDYIWNISEYEDQEQMYSDSFMGNWIWKNEDGWIQKVSISEGDSENGVEEGYFMVTESIYPGADPGMGGPYGGPLLIKGNQATYELNVSEGSLKTQFEILVENEQLILRWVGGDRYFSLQKINDEITFERPYEDASQGDNSTNSIDIELFSNGFDVNGAFIGDTLEKVVSMFGEPKEKSFGDERYDYSFEEALFGEKLMVVFGNKYVDYIQCDTNTEEGKLLSDSFIEVFPGNIYKATEDHANQIGVLSSLVFVYNEDSILIAEKREDSEFGVKRAYMLSLVYNWNVSRGWNLGAFTNEKLFTKIDNAAAIKEQ